MHIKPSVKSPIAILFLLFNSKDAYQTLYEKLEKVPELLI